MTSKSLEVHQDQWVKEEVDQRMMALQTSLNKIEVSIRKYENIVEECQMLESEAYQDDQDVPGSGDAAEDDVSMADTAASDHSESSGHDSGLLEEFQMEVEADDNLQVASEGGILISPEEDDLLTGE